MRNTLWRGLRQSAKWGKADCRVTLVKRPLMYREGEESRRIHAEGAGVGLGARPESRNVQSAL